MIIFDSDLIRYWAYLCESEGTLVVERRFRNRHHGSVKRNLKVLDSGEYHKDRIKKLNNAFMKLDSNHNDLLNTFIDNKSRTLPPIEYRGHTYRIWFEMGNCWGGAIHISIKHLIDGGYAWAGGFTLQELNEALKGLQNITNIRRESSGKDLTIEWIDSSKKEWRLVAKKSVSKKWVVNSIYVLSVTDDQTIKRVQEMYPKKS